MAYPIATEALDLEVYNLAALFAGSAELQRLGEEHAGLKWVRQTFETSEVFRRLIALAVTLRSSLDEFGREPVDVVGKLMVDNTPSQSTDLKLREACNKVIHAESVEFHPGAGVVDRDTLPLSSVLEIWGTHHGKRWRVDLDVFAFLNAAVRHF